MEKKHFRENWLIFLGIWGEAEIILRIWEAKEKYFRGAEEFSFVDFGRSMHYFQGSREHRPTWGLTIGNRKKRLKIVDWHVKHNKSKISLSESCFIFRNIAATF